MDYLEIKNLCLTYYNKKTKETVNAINDLSVTIPLGKITVVVGQIGCGKTSLIRVISGTLPYDSGTILYKGKDIDKIYVEDRKFAYVSQDVSMFHKKTIFDNLCIPLLGKKLKRDEIRQRVFSIAEEFDIAYLLSRKSREISIGQVQKANIAKAFLREPDIYLLDEPFSNLDREFVEEFRKTLKDKLQKENSTCIFVTHNIEDALYLADYLAVMKDGQIVCFGTKTSVYYGNNKDAIELLHAEDKDEE